MMDTNYSYASLHTDVHDGLVDCDLHRRDKDVPLPPELWQLNRNVCHSPFRSCLRTHSV